MKRIISLSASAALLLSIAVPAMAMVNPSAVANRISRRLLEDKTMAERRIPVNEAGTMLKLRERRVAAPETTGRINLNRAGIMTRIRTLRGARTINTRGDRPSRRAIMQDAESMLVLPPALVQTGGEATFQKVSRRTLRQITEKVNRIQVGE